MDAAGDQRAEDALCLTFTFPPLTERLEIVGLPSLRLDVVADRLPAQVVARLCDLWPDGRSTLVTRGLLDLTHRAAGEPVTVGLDAIAYSVPAGHRFRLAVSPGYWPWAWPAPEPVTLIVLGGELTLPVRRGRTDDDPPAHFAKPERAPGPGVERLPSRPPGRTVRHDVATGLIEIVHDLGYFDHVRFLDDGLEYDATGRDTYRIVDGDPLSALTTSERRIAISRGGWRTRVETSSSLSAPADVFHVGNTLTAYEGEVRVFARTWRAEVPRRSGTAA